MKKKITLIKLGGSIITNKDIPMSLRSHVLSRLVAEIAKVKKELEAKGELLIVGHGQGSFAHVPAVKYQTMNGFINDESVLGMAIVQDSAAQLNRKVVYEFLRHDIPAVSFYASNTILTKSRAAQEHCFASLYHYLDNGLLPITCGDVLADQQQGCTIWSTEEILAFMSTDLKKKGYEVNRVIHVTEVEGFLNHAGEIVEQINQKNWETLKSALNSTKGFDVTGGMALKVDESLALAKQKVKSYIVSGLKKGNLKQVLLGEEFVGTEIA
jgi:isopentenyl phosphate kinase